MKNESIVYDIDGQKFRGELVYDSGINKPRPALLMAPNWLGVTPLAVDRAGLLAQERYVVFIADMYGDGKRPKDFPEAAQMSDPIKNDPDLARKRINAALATLLKEGQSRGIVDASRRAAVGFCFGGNNVLELARGGGDVQAVVSIHGDFLTPKPAQKGAVKAAVLALHGSVDPVAPKAHRDALETEMEAAGAKWWLMTFGSLLHAYTDDLDIPGVAKYDEPASRWSYDMTHAFIADAFAGRL